MNTFKRNLRKGVAIFLSSTLFILVAAVALVLARGNTITDQGITQTGTIRLNINPSTEVTVFLDEQKQENITANSLTNLIPKDYDLRLEKQDYTSWHQTVTVRAGLITDISAQLFPVDLQLEQLTKSTVDKVFFSPDRRYVFYTVLDTKVGSEIGIWKQTLQQSTIPIIEEKPLKITNVNGLIRDDLENGTYGIQVSPDSNKILLQTSSQYFVLDAGSYNEPSTTNTLALSYPTEDIHWLKNSSNLLIQSDQLLIDYDLDKQTSTVITYFTDGAKYSFISGGIVFPHSNKLFRYLSGKPEEIKLENVSLPSGITNIYTGGDSDKDIILEKGTMLYYLDTADSFFTEIGRYQILSMSKQGKNLLVKDGTTIKSIAIEVSISHNTTEFSVNSTALTDMLDLGSIVWDANSSYFIFRNTGEDNKIYSADNTGNNINILLLSDNIASDAYGIPIDNSGLIVVMLDDANNTPTRQANLYKLKFK